LTSRSARHIEDQLDFAALCLIGTTERKDRYAGDNEQAQPLRLVVTTGKPKDAPEIYNRGVWRTGEGYVVLAYVYVETRTRGDRLKRRAEELIFGNAVELENKWRDGDPDAWIMLVRDALVELGYEAWDEDGKQAYIKRMVKRRR